MAKELFSDDERQAIKALRDSGLTWPDTAEAASEKLGRPVTAESVRFQYRKITAGRTTAFPVASPAKPAKPRSKAPKGQTLDAFRDQFDVTKKIRDRVGELLSDDRDEWFTDDQFRSLCGVSVQNWRRHADRDEFRPYQFRKPSRKFHAWAPKAIILAMREIDGTPGH